MIGGTDALEEARDALFAAGESEPAAEAEAFLAHGAWYRGDRDTAQRHYSQAEALVADGNASASKTRVLALSARFRMLKGDHEQAIRVAQEALTLAEALELDELRAHALTTIGSAKFHMDLSTGRPELEEGLRIALAADSPIAAVSLNNLGVLSIWEGNFARSREIYPEAQRIAERFGDRDSARFMRGNWIFGSYVVGRWDEAMQAADAFILECASSPHYAEGLARDARATIRVARGDFDGAREDLEFILEHARRIQDPQRLLPALANSAVIRLSLGDEHEARELAAEAVALAREHIHMAASANHLIFVAGQFGLRDAYRQSVESAPRGPWQDLSLAGATGDLQRAGDLYASFGSPSFEALARLFGGEDLIATGRRAEGEAEIERALAFHRSVGATFYIQRGERLLAEAQSASA